MLLLLRCQHLNELGYLLVGLAAALPCFILPLVLPNKVGRHCWKVHANVPRLEMLTWCTVRPAGELTTLPAVSTDFLPYETFSGNKHVVKSLTAWHFACRLLQ